MTLATRARPVDRRKDPDATLDFGFDWGTKWLQTGETLSSSAWAADSGLTIESSPDPTTIIDDTTTAAWVSGGTAGASYILTNTVVTSAGRTDERSFRIHIVER